MEAKRPEANVAPSRTTVASGWTGSSIGCARNLAIGSSPGLPRSSILSPPRGATNLGKLIHVPVRDHITTGPAIQKPNSRSKFVHNFRYLLTLTHPTPTPTF